VRVAVLMTVARVAMLDFSGMLGRGEIGKSFNVIVVDSRDPRGLLVL